MLFSHVWQERDIPCLFYGARYNPLMSGAIPCYAVRQDLSFFSDKPFQFHHILVIYAIYLIRAKFAKLLLEKKFSFWTLLFALLKSTLLLLKTTSSLSWHLASF